MQRPQPQEAEMTGGSLGLCSTGPSSSVSLRGPCRLG